MNGSTIEGGRIASAVPLPPSAVLAVMPVVADAVLAVPPDAAVDPIVGKVPPLARLLPANEWVWPGSVIVLVRVAAGRLACAIVLFCAPPAFPAMSHRNSRPRP